MLVGEKAVDVERQVVLVEPGVVLEDAREEIARGLEIRVEAWAALVDGLRLPCAEALDELLALELPLQLAEAEERLGHLASLARSLGDEGREEADGLAAQRLDLRDVTVDARLELLLELLAERVIELRAVRGGAAAWTVQRARAGALRTLLARLDDGLRDDGRLGGRADARRRGRARAGRGIGGLALVARRRVRSASRTEERGDAGRVPRYARQEASAGTQGHR